MAVLESCPLPLKSVFRRKVEKKKWEKLQTFRVSNYKKLKKGSIIVKFSGDLIAKEK